jgi:hypothetical protein
MLDTEGVATGPQTGNGRRLGGRGRCDARRHGMAPGEPQNVQLSGIRGTLGQSGIRENSRSGQNGLTWGGFQGKIPERENVRGRDSGSW